MPKVSVVIPTYNCARFLPEALDSVLAQTYRDFEVIVMDDGSTDDTPAVMSRYPAVRYLRQANVGPGAARNAAIRAARGELIAFLDADDLWLSAKLERQVPTFDDPEVGICYSDLRELAIDGKVTPSFLATRPLAASGYIFENLRSMLIYTTTTVVRRVVFDQVGGFAEDMPSAQDREMWFRICYRWKAALANEVLAVYRRRAESVTGDNSKLSRDGLRLWKRVLTDFELTPRFAQLARSHLGRAYYERGYFFRHVGRRRAARLFLRRSLSINPADWLAWKCLVDTLMPPSWTGAQGAAPCWERQSARTAAAGGSSACKSPTSF